MFAVIEDRGAALSVLTFEAPQAMQFALSPELLRLRAEAFYLQGNRIQARADLIKAQSLRPEDPQFKTLMSKATLYQNSVDIFQRPRHY